MQLAAMLAVKRLAGVALDTLAEVYLRYSEQARKHASRRSTLTLNPRAGKESKTGVSVTVTTQKEPAPSIFFN